MWTNENRGRYDRSKLRYPSDLGVSRSEIAWTDAEWALVGPLIPPAKRGGNKRTVDIREVVNGLIARARHGLPFRPLRGLSLRGIAARWAALPKDLPARSTVHDCFRRWDDEGTLERIHHALYVRCRELAGRDASPSAAVVTRRRVPDIDSQSVKSAEKGGAASIRRAMTRARRSAARSATSWSIRKAC